MEQEVFIRAINWDSGYSKEQQRFRSDRVFKPYKGGISVFLESCAIAESNTICNHIDVYYRSTVENPAVYWKIPVSKFKAVESFNKVEIKKIPSSKPGINGKLDKCHYDLIIDEVLKDECDNFATLHCNPPDVIVCLNNYETSITEEHLKDFKVWAKANRNV